MYKVLPETDTKYWRDDGLQWRFLRSAQVPKGSPTLKKCTFRLIAGGELVDIRRIEFHKLGKQKLFRV